MESRKCKKGFGWSALAAAITLLVGTSAFAGLLHNSASVGTKYGTWGVTGGKYGNITCATCHNKSTTNIKRVATTITAPLGSWSTSKTPNLPIVFNNVTGTIGASMGNDLGGHASSTKVCEACHSKTQFHRYNTTGQTDLTHANNRDCVSCHTHDKGFTASCNQCHGYPPSIATPGVNGLATPATNATGGAVGAHVVHDARAMTCNTCHSGFNTDHQNQQPAYNNIQLGFDINVANVPSFGPVAVTTGSYTPNSAMFGGYSVVSSKAGTTINAEAAGASNCTIYCHNFSGANGNEMTPLWTSTTAGNCGQCHGVSAGQVPNSAQTGAHTRHAGTAGSGNLQLSCTSCHGSTTDNTHVDGKVGFNLGSALIIGAGKTYTPNGGSAAVSGSTNKLAPSATYGTCNNIYCHSSIQGAGGTGAPTYVSPTWGGGALNCTTSCHLGDTTLATGSHAKHITASSSKGAYACSVCHTGGSGSSLHADGTINISMAAGTYGQTGAPQNGYSNCTVTCHAGAASLPLWGGTINAGCDGCHGNKATAATRLSVPHNAHMSNLAAGAAFSCTDCHANVVSNDTTVSANGMAVHVNTFINFSGAYAAKQQGAAGSITCSTTSCHNSGKASAPRVPVTWNTATIDCSGCHGAAGITSGMPSPDQVGVNAHVVHVGAAGAANKCVQCHDTTVDGANAIIAGSAHLNKTRDVRFSKVNSFAAYSGSFSAAGRTCSATYCHGGTNGSTPLWGSGTLACSACHAAVGASLGGAHTIHNSVAATSYATAPGTSSTSATAYNFNCSACHGVDTTKHVDYPQGAASDATIFFGFSTAGKGGTGKYTPAASGSTDAQGFKWTNGNAAANCNTTYCHSNGQGGNAIGATISWGTSTRNATCTTCHGSVATVAGGLSGAHSSHMNNSTQGGGFGCVDCHATTVSGNLAIAANGYNKHVNKFVDYSGLYAGKNKTCANIYCHSNGSGSFAAVTWTGGAIGCAGCHGTTDTTGKGTPATGNHVKHMAVASDCFMCHNTSTNAANTISSVPNHINRASVPAPGSTWKGIGVNFTNGGTAGPGNRTCSTITCHGNGSVLATWGNTLDCNGCHPLANLSGGANSGHIRHIGALTVSQVKFYNYTANKSPNAAEGGTVMYGFGCVNCHPSAAASHFNGSIDVVLNHTLPAEGVLANMTPSGATVNGTVGTGTVTCTATYCHGNGVARINTTPAWNANYSAAVDRCAQCHLNSPTTNAHTAHTVGIHFDDIFNGRSGKLPTSGATNVNAAHGAGNRATTMDCYICHNMTINVAGNDKNSYCVTCHVSGNSVGASFNKPAKITNLMGHVNGTTDVAFAGTQVRTKAQLRDGSFDSYTSIPEGQWKRNRGYKNYTSSYDYTVQTLAARATWSKGTATCATVACHGGGSPLWNATPLTCDACHVRL